MEEGEEVAYGTQPAKDKRVENCKMYFGDPDATGDLKDFSAAEADNHVDGYTAYTKGNNVNGNKDAGTIYVFMPAVAGNITVAVVLNSGKAFHINEDGTDMAGYEGITVDEKYYGTYTFDVKAGSTYKVWCDGSKLGFYGFEFKEGSSAGINTVKSASENGVRYNLAGQKVAEGYKGVVIMNGRKMIQK
jgi:hypothetical protein